MSIEGHQGQHPLGPGWEAVLSLTAEMESQAGDGAWERVAELEQQRRASLEAFFAAGVAEDRAEAVAEAIEAVMARDRAVVERCETAKKSVVQQMLSLNNSHRAANAYATT